jgi:alpha/beta superfamily hydrolase
MSNEPVTLPTSDGVLLEGELARPSDPPWAAAVLCHPHPQQGGNMRSIVPGTLFAELPAAGVAALRFNFRGVGASGGAYDGGVGERLDVLAALDALAPLVAGPLALAGWSFGADVSLSVGDIRVGGLFCAAPPLRMVEPSTMAAATDLRPKLLAIGERDQFRPPASARAVVNEWPNCRIEVIPGADHFFVGRTDRLAPLCLELLRAIPAGAG